MKYRFKKNECLVIATLYKYNVEPKNIAERFDTTLNVVNNIFAEYRFNDLSHINIEEYDDLLDEPVLFNGIKYLNFKNFLGALPSVNKELKKEAETLFEDSTRKIRYYIFGADIVSNCFLATNSKERLERLKYEKFVEQIKNPVFPKDERYEVIKVTMDQPQIKYFGKYKVGKKVNHKVFGKGKILRFENDLVYVKFSDKARMFNFEYVRKNNILQCDV